MLLAKNARYERFTLVGSPIRTPPDQSLLSSSPKIIAAMLRPSSPCKVKASAIYPYFLLPIQGRRFVFLIALIKINNNAINFFKIWLPVINAPHPRVRVEDYYFFKKLSFQQTKNRLLAVRTINSQWDVSTLSALLNIGFLYS